MISRETEVEINYLHHQRLSYREIARKTNRDRRTVKKYAENPQLIGRPRQHAERGSSLDQYMPMIEEWLKDDDQYKATWILDHIRMLGYTGGYTVVKDAVRAIKQERSRIAYLRFETEPGRQGQVDFGDFKAVRPDGSEITLYMFGMILGYGRGMYGEFLDKCDMVNFLDAHQRALASLGGVPEEIIYDRMRNVFIRKLCGKTQFTQGLMTLADHYGFKPDVTPAYSPWVKGKDRTPYGLHTRRLLEGIHLHRHRNRKQRPSVMAE